MSLDLANYEVKTPEAVKAFWQSREDAKKKQLESGKVDQGERAGVTGGKNMDGFTDLIADIVRKNGLSHAQIHQQKAALTLPGYFRPTKLWDIIVMHKGQPPLNSRARWDRLSGTTSTTERKRPSAQHTACGLPIVRGRSASNLGLSLAG